MLFSLTDEYRLLETLARAGDDDAATISPRDVAAGKNVLATLRADDGITTDLAAALTDIHQKLGAILAEQKPIVGAVVRTQRGRYTGIDFFRDPTQMAYTIGWDLREGRLTVADVARDLPSLIAAGILPEAWGGKNLHPPAALLSPDLSVPTFQQPRDDIKCIETVSILRFLQGAREGSEPERAANRAYLSAWVEQMAHHVIVGKETDTDRLMRAVFEYVVTDLYAMRGDAFGLDEKSAKGLAALSPALRRAVGGLCQGRNGLIVAWAVRRLAESNFFTLHTDAVQALGDWLGEVSPSNARDRTMLAQHLLFTWAAPLMPRAADTQGGHAVRGIAVLAQRDPLRLVEWSRQISREGFLKVTLGDVTFATRGAPTPQAVVTAEANALVHLVAPHWETFRATLDLRVHERMPDPDAQQQIQTWWKVDRLMHGDWYPHDDFFPRVVVQTDADPRQPILDAYRKTREQLRANVLRFYSAYFPEAHRLDESAFPIPVIMMERNGYNLVTGSRDVAIQRISATGAPGAASTASGRIARPAPDAAYRVYFYDPRLGLDRRWGKATVSTWGNGERPGEASMTFAEFSVNVAAYPIGGTGKEVPLPKSEQDAVNRAASMRIFPE